MILKLSGPLRIENLRHYPTEMVDRLRCLLVDGASANPDPHRKNFFDLDDRDRAFFIHISPTGTVLLLATWHRAGTPLASHPAALAKAAACCA